MSRTVSEQQRACLSEQDVFRQLAANAAKKGAQSPKHLSGVKEVFGSNIKAFAKIWQAFAKYVGNQIQ